MDDPHANNGKVEGPMTQEVIPRSVGENCCDIIRGLWHLVRSYPRTIPRAARPEGRSRRGNDAGALVSADKEEAALENAADMLPQHETGCEYYNIGDDDELDVEPATDRGPVRVGDEGKTRQKTWNEDLVQEEEVN